MKPETIKTILSNPQAVDYLASDIWEAELPKDIVPPETTPPMKIIILLKDVPPNDDHLRRALVRALAKSGFNITLNALMQTWTVLKAEGEPTKEKIDNAFF